MIIGEKSTTIAYRCPACGAYVMSLVGIFALNGDMVRLKCSCGQSEMQIVNGADRKIRLTVPCLTCPHPHNFTVSGNLFFDKDLFSLNCPYTDLDICFMGGREAVMKAAEDSDKALLQMMKGYGLDDFNQLRGNDLITDDDYFDSATLSGLARFLLCELADEGKVVCRCEHPEPDQYDMELLGDTENSVRFFCKKCGASAVYPAQELFYGDGSIKTEKLYLL